MTTATNPLQTRLTEEFGIEYPVIAFTHCKDVLAAVVNAGGLGVIGAAGWTPDEIEKNVKWIRERVGDKPFGVDLLVPASVPPGGSREELAEQVPQGHREFIETVMRDYNIPAPREEPGDQQRGMGYWTQENPIGGSWMLSLSYGQPSLPQPSETLLSFWRLLTNVGSRSWASLA